MIEPPRDRRILVLHYNRHYSHAQGGYRDTPYPVWTHVHWVDNQHLTGNPLHFEEWTGDPRTSSSHHIEPSRVLAWAEVPVTP